MADIFNRAQVPSPVQVMGRICTGRATFTFPAATVKTLAECAGGVIPAGSVACKIQADGGILRMTSDGSTPSATIGFRIDDGVFYDIDTVLENIRLIAQAGSTTVVQIKFYDRV